MKPASIYSLFAALAAALAAAVLGVAMPSTTKTQEQDTVQTMTTKMKTVCVGRFLVDLPANAQVAFPPATFGSIVVNVWPGYSTEKFNQEIAQREHELKQQRNEYDRMSLEKKIEANAVNFKATLFYYGREKPFERMELGKKVSIGGDGISVEAFGFYDGRVFHVSGTSLDADKYMDSVLSLVARVEARPGDTIPRQPGFCIEDAFVHDPLPDDSIESITMFATLPGHPDLAIRLSTFLNWRSITKSLLERDAESSINKFFPGDIRNLRRGSRALDDMQGTELIDKFKEENGTSSHLAMWFGPGKIKDALAPEFSLELQTGIGRPGEPVNASISDDAFIALWDQITKSIRVRPTSTAPRQMTEPRVPLGAVSRTGSKCPQSGHWTCSESDHGEGGSRQYFAAGQLMPAAVLSCTPTLWQKVCGSPSTICHSTDWTLVAYECQGESGVPADPQAPD